MSSRELNRAIDALSALALDDARWPAAFMEVLRLAPPALKRDLFEGAKAFIGEPDFKDSSGEPWYREETLCARLGMSAEEAARLARDLPPGSLKILPPAGSA